MVEHVDDIQVLVDLVDLVDIRKNEERARRIKIAEASDDVRHENSLGVTRNFPNGFSFRLRSVVGLGDAEYVADLTAIYEFNKEATVSDSTINEFIERVAFFALYPFLRESVFASATRLGQPVPVMGLIKAGQLHFGERMTDEEVQTNFFDNQSELN